MSYALLSCKHKFIKVEPQGENAQRIAELELQVNTLNHQLASAQAASEQTQVEAH